MNFLGGFQNIEKRVKKCIGLLGKYVDKSKVLSL